MIISILILLGTIGACAQSVPEGNEEKVQSGQTQTATADATVAVPDQSDGNSSQTQYVPALNGSGLISLDEIRKFHVLAGGTFAGGIDSNPNNVSDGKSSILTSISPYIGVMASTTRSHFILQYFPTVTRYSSYAGASMHNASVKFIGSLSPRLSWTLSSDGSHGDDSIRLLGPSHSVQIGTVAGDGSGYASYLPNAGTVTNIDGGFEIHYSLSPTNALGLQITNSYNSFPALNESGSVASSTINYTHALNSGLGIVAYQQTSKYYGQLNCATFGGGAGIRWQPREDTVLTMRGGPQLDTPSCDNQQGFSYSVSFSTKVVGRAQLYLMSDRVPVTGYLGPGLWQNDISGGYQRQIFSRNIFAVDAGYVQSSTLSNAGAYDGTFVDVSYSRQLGRTLSITSLYRTYSGSLGNVNFSRNMATISLTLTPNTRTLSQ